MKNRFPLLILSLITLISCGTTNPTPIEEPEDLYIASKSMYVYGQNGAINVVNAEEGETFSYSYEGDNLRIEDNKIIALRAGTSTRVSVNSNHHRSGAFTVNILNREYTSTHLQTEQKEGWFNEVNIDKVNSLTTDFANGMDISSVKQLYDVGQQFYNKEGYETSLFLILKDAGINWIRLRLWNDPKDTYIENGETKTYLYGGGNCDRENVLWMLKEAKLAGLKVLLTFHYSDFWADPSNQIVPKAWVNISSPELMAETIKNYTKDTLNYFKSYNVLPDMVAIGNEISSGMLHHNPGPVTTAPQETPNYMDHTDRKNGTQAKYTSGASLTNLVNYVKAAAEGIKEVNPNILTSIHYVKGLSAPDNSLNFFRLFKDVDIDVYSLSAYPYYHFGNKSTLVSGLNTISEAMVNEFPGKKLAIAETAYGFTFEVDTNASNGFAIGGKCGPVSGYSVNVQGQANLIRDVTETVSNLSNGFGVFYWEGAWTPKEGAGWADAASRASWANQALFSYNGKALASLEVYRKMLGGN